VVDACEALVHVIGLVGAEVVGSRPCRPPTLLLLAAAADWADQLDDDPAD
jgi:hypothetical protein